MHTVIGNNHGQEQAVEIPVGAQRLQGDLYIPGCKSGMVLFAHGSGSSRHSPRNRYVARVLQREGLGTLLFDLLTEEEEAVDERTGRLRFDIGLLATRLVGATDWLLQSLGHSNAGELPRIGYFGASTGAAAALVAAAKRADVIRAVVSRGGRPDLAGEHLYEVRAPTLLLVGENDKQVIRLNQDAYDKLTLLKNDEKKLTIVTGATHLFEEPGTLEQVARFASGWFLCFLNQGANN